MVSSKAINQHTICHSMLKTKSTPSPSRIGTQDFDVRNWNYPTRAAMVSYHHRAREAEVEIGYLLEGKADDELPEQHLSS